MEPLDADLMDLLQARDSHRTIVVLRDGKELEVDDIAWGYDMDDRYAHVTTNASPRADGAPIDFFYTDDVQLVIDPSDSRVLFKSPQPSWWQPRSWSCALAEADQVVIVDGGSYDHRRRKQNKVAGTTSDREAINELCRCLDWTFDDTERALMTPGSPTLAFLSRGDVIATVTLINHRYVRCAEFFPVDLGITDAPRLAKWVRAHSG